jgi:uncharacterized protein YndB with AHSA1/START domain
MAAEEGRTELVMTRLCDAPRRLVFDVWTHLEHLRRWQGAPDGFTVTAPEVVIRRGGEFQLILRSPEGDLPLAGEYREVVPPERLVFTHAWLDEEGRLATETLVTMTFGDRGDQTEITLRQEGFVSVTSRDGHEEGWGGTLDRLARYLAGPARRVTPS